MSNIEQGMRYTNGYDNSQVKKQKIINNVSGIIKPSRLILNTHASRNTHVFWYLYIGKRNNVFYETTLLTGL